MNEIWKTIYRLYILTASCVGSWRRQLAALIKSYCLDLFVTPSYRNCSGPSCVVGLWRPWWRRQVTSLKILWIVTCIFHFHLFCNSWRRHVQRLDAVRYCSSKEIWDFVVFFTFMLQKRPKCFLFQISLQKYLKWQKERFRAIIDQIISNSGLNDPLKAAHFSPHQIPLHLRFACPQANMLLF